MLRFIHSTGNEVFSQLINVVNDAFKLTSELSSINRYGSFVAKFLTVDRREKVV